MGRSVMTHSGSVSTVYLDPFSEEDLEGNWGLVWEDFVEDLQDNVIPEIFPSMTPCDDWEERECHFIMENEHAFVSVSTYNSIVAIELVPKETPLAKGWCERMANKFHDGIVKMFPDSAMKSIGRFSNGEQVFERYDSRPVPA